MAPPPNLSMGTAQALGPLPVAFTVDLTELPAGAELWYSYTAQPTDVVIGAWFGSADQPWTNIWSLDFDWYGDVEAGEPLQLGVTPGETYYFEVGGFPNPPTAPLEVSLLLGPTLATPIDAIAINEDRDQAGGPLCILSPTTGEVLQFRHPFVSGEYGAVLPSGFTLWSNKYTPTVLSLFDATLSLVASVPWPATPAGASDTLVCSNRVDRFYVAHLINWSSPPTTPVVGRVSTTGVVGTTWTLPANKMMAIGISRDETVLYYIQDKFTTDGAIRAWDLIGNTSLGVLIPGLAGHAVLGRYSGEIVVLPDESILIGYYSVPIGTSQVRRFSRTGTLLQTYTLPGTVALNRVCHTNDGDVSFWAWTFAQHDGVAPDRGYSRFYRIRVADGAILADFEAAQFNSGAYAPFDYTTPLGAPTARFGHPFSCIIFSLPYTLPGDEPEPPPRESACPVVFPID